MKISRENENQVCSGLAAYTDSSYDGKRGPFDIPELIKH